MSALIEAHELSKRFESRGVVTAVLDAVELAIEAGEFVAIMGLSGSGKSTLLQILAGLTSPTAGEVYFGGERTDTLSETEQALHRREHVGCMFQFFGLIDDLTAAENIELPARIAGTELEAAEDRREELMTRLGIADRAGAYPYQLSGGYQQRVALARALMNQPRVPPTSRRATSTARPPPRRWRCWARRTRRQTLLRDARPRGERGGPVLRCATAGSLDRRTRSAAGGADPPRSFLVPVTRPPRATGAAL